MSKFRHECTEWDFMEIDENDMEFVACSCFDDPDATKIQDELQRQLDAHNEQK